MMGYKVRNLKTFTSFSLETLVPEDNFNRQVEKCIDLSFVRDLVCHLYSAFGRPSIDPDDIENDHYTCPQNHVLPLWSRRKSEEKYVYRADAKVCDACSVKGECTGNKIGRHIFRSFHQEYIDKVKAYYETEVYKKASRKRIVWVEPLFGEAKDFHRLRRFRLRGLHKVNIEGMMIAAGQNLKRLIKHRLEKIWFLAQYLISRLFPTEVSTFSTT